MRKFIYILLITILLFTGVGLYLYTQYASVQPNKRESASVIMKIRALNRLETAAFTIEKIIDVKENAGSKISEILFGDAILLVAHGEVIAGIDLSKMKAEDVVIDGTSIKVRLPAPEILTTRLDSEKTRVYDRKQGILTKGDKDIESKARAEAETAIKKAACDGKILDRAYENAQKQIRAVLTSFDFEKIEITSDLVFVCK